jgi:hypothetical protein
MAYQGCDLQLTRYDERGWRATFYTTGMEHSPTSATGTGWERTPWHATVAGGVGGVAEAEQLGRALRGQQPPRASLKSNMAEDQPRSVPDDAVVAPLDGGKALTAQAGAPYE